MRKEPEGKSTIHTPIAYYEINHIMKLTKENLFWHSGIAKCSERSYGQHIFYNIGIEYLTLSLCI